jgi:hypothetical protein
VLGRARYVRARAPEHVPGVSESGSEVSVAQPVLGHRNGHRDRELMGTFGKTTISVPRAYREGAVPDH